jgi:hypothetical protein
VRRGAVDSIQIMLSLPKFTPKEWFAVCDLAARWDMENFITALIKVNPFQDTNKFACRQLCLGIRLQRRDWIEDGIKGLLNQGESISEEDILRLGPPLASRIGALRETMLRDQANCYRDKIARAWELHQSIEHTSTQLDAARKPRGLYTFARLWGGPGMDTVLKEGPQFPPNRQYKPTGDSLKKIHNVVEQIWAGKH